MKQQTALSVDNPQIDSCDPQTEAIARLEKELKAALESHRQFGDLSPDASGARRFMQKVIRRSLTWYTRPNQLFQAAVIRALEDVASILKHQRDDHEVKATALKTALSACELSINSMNHELHAIRDQLAEMRTRPQDGNGQRNGTSSAYVNPTVAPWDIHFPETATESDIIYCFRLLLGRNPKKQEWPGHSFRVGEPLEPLVQNYLNSEEFAGRHLLDRRAGSAELVELPKFKIYASSEDTFIGKVIIQSREYEPHVTRILQQYLRPGMIVADIGANIGYFSLLAASLVGQDGVVYSWEPSPSNARMLYASQLANGFTNIKIVQAAATETSGLLGYFRSSSNGNVAEIAKASPDDVLGAETVMGLRIDDVLPRDARVAFVKIDVEGFEFRALTGARAMLERCRPIIVSEFSPEGLLHSSGVSGREYLEFFASYQYELSLVTDNGPVAATIEEALSRCEQSGTDHVDILLKPGRAAGT